MFLTLILYCQMENMENDQSASLPLGEVDQIGLSPCLYVLGFNKSASIRRSAFCKDVFPCLCIMP